MSLLDWIGGKSLSDQIARLELKIDLTRQIGIRLMATVLELQDKLAAIDTAISEERAEVQELLGGLRAQIQALQDQIGAGQLVTQEQLDGLAASADAIVERVRAISEPVA